MTDDKCGCDESLRLRERVLLLRNFMRTAAWSILREPGKPATAEARWLEARLADDDRLAQAEETSVEEPVKPGFCKPGHCPDCDSARERGMIEPPASEPSAAWLSEIASRAYVTRMNRQSEDRPGESRHDAAEDAERLALYNAGRASQDAELQALKHAVADAADANRSQYEKLEVERAAHAATKAELAEVLENTKADYDNLRLERDHYVHEAARLGRELLATKVALQEARKARPMPTVHQLGEWFQEGLDAADRPHDYLQAASHVHGRLFGAQEEQDSGSPGSAGSTGSALDDALPTAGPGDSGSLDGMPTERRERLSDLESRIEAAENRAKGAEAYGKELAKQFDELKASLEDELSLPNYHAAVVLIRKAQERLDKLELDGRVTRRLVELVFNKEGPMFMLTFAEHLARIEADEKGE